MKRIFDFIEKLITHNAILNVDCWVVSSLLAIFVLSNMI